MKRCLGLVLAGVALCALAAAEDALELGVGQVRLRAFVQPVRDVAVQSASNAIATAWVSDGEGVFVRGENPGRTVVTVRAKKGDDGEETIERIRVTVADAVREADDGRRVDGPTLVVKEGQTRTARFSRQTIGVRRFVSQPQIASVRLADDALTIRGLRPGWSTLTVSGEFVGFRAGANVPLQNNTRFNFQYNVHVVPRTSVIRVAEAVDVELGKTWSMPLSRHASGISVASADSATASAGRSGQTLEIRGRRIGETTVTVTGKLASWPVQPDGGTERVEDPFEFTYRVTVKPAAYPGAEDVHRDVKSALEALREQLRGLPDALASFRDALGEPEGVSGVWKTGSGAANRMVQEGGRISFVLGSGLVFGGAANGAQLALAKRYRAASEIPGNLPNPVKEQLVGSELKLEGTLGADGTRFAATLLSEEVKFNAQTFEITSREPKRGTVQFVKQPDPPIPLPDVAPALAAVQSALTRLDQAFEAYQSGEKPGAEFVDEALLDLYAGAVEGVFKARLDAAAAQVEMLERRHRLALRDLGTLFDAEAGEWAALNEAQRAAARTALEARFRPREQAVYDAVAGRHRQAAEALVGVQRALARDLFAWENFSREHQWDATAQKLYRRAFELLCYRLDQQPEFGGASVLDAFVAGPDSLPLPPWLNPSLRTPLEMDDAFGEEGLSRLHARALAEHALPGEPEDPEAREGRLTVTVSGSGGGSGSGSGPLDLLVDDPNAPANDPNNPNNPNNPNHPNNPNNPNAGPVQTRSFAGAKPGAPPLPAP